MRTSTNRPLSSPSREGHVENRHVCSLSVAAGVARRRRRLLIDINQIIILHSFRDLTVDDICQAVDKLGDVSAQGVVRLAEALSRSANEDTRKIAY